MISSQNQTTNTNTVKTSARKLANVNPPSNGNHDPPTCLRDGAAAARRSPNGQRYFDLRLHCRNLFAHRLRGRKLALVTHRLRRRGIRAGRRGRIRLGSGRPHIGNLADHRICAGSLPSSPIVLGGALVTVCELVTLLAAADRALYRANAISGQRERPQSG
jgi:hypothetical protein